MSAYSQTEISVILNTVKEKKVVETLYREDVLFDLPGLEPEDTPSGHKLNGIIPYVPSLAGTGLDWPVSYASTDAEEMDSETSVIPEPGHESYVNATQAYRYFWTTLKIYRQSIDACQGEAAVVDLTQRALLDRLRSLRNIINTTLLGTGTGNLQAIIDSTSTYAGISSRSTYGFDSYEAAVGGAIALSDLEDMVEALDLKGVPLEECIILARPNQVTNLMNLAGWAGNSVVQKYTETGGAFDPSFIRSRISVCGIPVVETTSLTSTVILLMHIPSFEWRVHKSLLVEPKETQDYSYAWLVLTSIKLRCLKPHWQGKLTGVTA